MILLPVAQGESGQRTKKVRFIFADGTDVRFESEWLQPFTKSAASQRGQNDYRMANRSEFELHVELHATGRLGGYRLSK